MTQTSSPRRLVRLLLALTGLLTALSTALVALPAQAAGTRYVALGDSFSSGVGSRDYYDDGTDCARSPRSYGALIAARRDLDLTLAACSGATTADVLAGQVGSLTASTSYVTMTIGGNDVGFADVLTECALPGWASNCDDAVDGGLAVLRSSLPGRVHAVLAEIGARAPNAAVVVAGYPHLFNGADCNALTFFGPDEQSRLNAATDELNAMLAEHAAAAGAAFADPVAAFDDHAVCDEAEWVNGLSNPTLNSYHPNVDGHAAYAGLVESAFFGSPTTASDVSPAVVLPKVSSAAGPFRFRTPDLTSPQVRAAADRAGITAGRLDRMNDAQPAAEPFSSAGGGSRPARPWRSAGR